MSIFGLAGRKPQASGPPKTHPGRLSTRTLTVWNWKGGVTKTTTAFNLSVILAERGYRVLMVDMDPQGNLTFLTRGEVESGTGVVNCLFRGEPLSKNILSTDWRNLDICPGGPDMSAELLEGMTDGKGIPPFDVLYRAIADIDGAYDYIMIDGPPSLEAFSLYGLMAASGAAIPIEWGDPFSFLGFRHLHSVLKWLTLYNPSFRVLGCFRTKMMRGRQGKSEKLWEQFRTQYPDYCMEASIPYQRAFFRDAVMEGRTVFEGNDLMFESYESLLNELLERMVK